ncbi:MAG: GlcNAc-PI de-N-acetylase [Desulfosporosinus sp. BRH_c37]|nr:MAG: GlcNAc-PI de-N-acetylase [Desulfosporosinus sp. BRH_c37]
MSKNVVVITPHPDDETLGCGGTLLRHKYLGDSIYWLIVTGIHLKDGFTLDEVNRRMIEIQNIKQIYGFESTISLDFQTAKLDCIPMDRLVRSIGDAFKDINPQVVYVPFGGDIHTDHRIVFDAVSACTKWFRYSSIERVLAYETLSETEFGLNPSSNSFRPNVFINIENHIEKKIEAMKIYSSEMGEFPFPRSEHTIRALASLRGSTAGCRAAEAFMLLKEIL